MDDAIRLSSETRGAAGVILLTLLFVEVGGYSVLRMVRGQYPATEFQKTFARAGHAHAGVLLTLALIGQVLADGARLDGALRIPARNGIWLAAILMSAGFFLSSSGRDAVTPNRLIVLVYLGAASLAVGVASLGVGLLRA